MSLMDEYRKRAELEGFSREPNVLPEVLPSSAERRELDFKRAETEEEITDKVRTNAQKSAQKLERLVDSINPDEMKTEERIAAVRAISDAQNKSVDALMKMTGRDKEAPRDNMVDVLAGMAQRGFSEGQRRHADRLCAGGRGVKCPSPDVGTAAMTDGERTTGSSTFSATTSTRSSSAWTATGPSSRPYARNSTSCATPVSVTPETIGSYGRSWWPRGGRPTREGQQPP
jgi:hypothetical protein